MAKTWLYPLNSASGYHFEFGGKAVETSPDNFWLMVESGGKDDRWSIHTNFRNVAKGDRIVVYAVRPHSSPLIIGVGQLRSGAKFHRPWNSQTILIDWNRKLCSRLATWPIDATHLKRHLPEQKAAVVALPSALAKWVDDELATRGSFLKERSAEALAMVERPVGVKVTRIAGKSYEALLRHDPRVIVPFARRLLERGWEQLGRGSHGLYADLLVGHRKKQRLLLVEGKTNDRDGGRNEVRFAMGQLLDYRHFVVPAITRPGAWMRCDSLILMEQRPLPALVELAEANGFCIAWYEKQKVLAGPRTGKQLGGIFD